MFKKKIKFLHFTFINIFIIIFIFNLFLIISCSLKSNDNKKINDNKQSNANKNTFNFTKTINYTRKFIKHAMVEHKLVGLSIALVYKDKIIWAQGFGLANKKQNIPATKDTVYMLGSISKTLTAAALLRLYDQGKVKLDGSISNYLPKFSIGKRYNNQLYDITIKKLLNHHSGIPGDIYNGSFVKKSWDDWGKNLYSKWLLSYLKKDYPSYAPGEIAIYSNTGFELAGLITVKQGCNNSMNFNQYMTKYLFKPLNMNNSSFKQISKTDAIGYIDDEPMPLMECNEPATGGAFTTVIDMAKFVKMILRDSKHSDESNFLKQKTINMMGIAEVSSLDIDSYFQPGLGLDTVDDPVMRYAGRAWAKDGSTGNFNSFMEILPDKDLGVVILANSDTAALFKYAIARECLKNAVSEKYGIKPSLPKMPNYFSINDTKKIIGKYVCKNGFDQIIDNNDGTLSWITDVSSKQPKKYIIKYNGKRYSVKGKTENLVFKNISWNNNNHFVMIQYGSSGSLEDRYTVNGHVIRILGEKQVPTPVAKSWNKRLNKTYIIDNISINDLLWDKPFLKFKKVKNIFFVERLGDHMVILPESDNLAFLAGLKNRSDSCVRVIPGKDFEKIVFAGYTAYDINNVQSIILGDKIVGQVKFHEVDWYSFRATKPGKKIIFDILHNNTQFKIRLFNKDLDSIIAESNDKIIWNSNNEIVYLAISTNPNLGFNYFLKVREE